MQKLESVKLNEDFMREVDKLIEKGRYSSREEFYAEYEQHMKDPRIKKMTAWAKKMAQKLRDQGWTEKDVERWGSKEEREEIADEFLHDYLISSTGSRSISSMKAKCWTFRVTNTNPLTAAVAAIKASCICNCR